jgi:hypothetical protein
MNKERRKALRVIMGHMEMIETLRQEARDMLSDVLDEEQEALENMPESLQESERGQQMQEYIEIMEEVLDGFDDLDEHREWLYQLEEIVEE